MRIQLLRTFLVCAELRNFALAAQRLLYSESSVAYHIRDLEKSLGAQLFIREDGRLELTPAGALILRPTALLVRTADEMTELIKESVHSPDGVRSGPRRAVQGPRPTAMPVPGRELRQRDRRTSSGAPSPTEGIR